MDSTTSRPEPLWTVTQVAQYFACSESYIYELAQAGTIPCGRVGKLIRFDPVDIHKWWSLRKGR
jgi:excisionase family DNA binding protein